MLGNAGGKADRRKRGERSLLPVSLLVLCVKSAAQPQGQNACVFHLANEYLQNAIRYKSRYKNNLVEFYF
jgi:hypothetical protein